MPLFKTVLIEVTPESVKRLCDRHCKKLVVQVLNYAGKDSLSVKSCGKSTCKPCGNGESAAPSMSRPPKGHMVRLIAHTGRFSHRPTPGTLGPFLREGGRLAVGRPVNGGGETDLRPCDDRRERSGELQRWRANHGLQSYSERRADSLHLQSQWLSPWLLTVLCVARSTAKGAHGDAWVWDKNVHRKDDHGRDII
jgi:hypothetical protein